MLPPREDLSVNGWNAVVHIVLNGTFYRSREVGQHLIARGQGGAVQTTEVTTPYLRTVLLLP